MKSALIAIAILVLCASVCVAGQPPTQGTIVSMQSVECGQKHEGKKKSTALLCQQYVVHTVTAEYRIRQQKPEEQEILPANTPIQFTLDKHKMKFKANGKKYEYLVVGMTGLEKSHYEGPELLNAASDCPGERRSVQLAQCGFEGL